jgi:chitinase
MHLVDRIGGRLIRLFLLPPAAMTSQITVAALILAAAACSRTPAPQPEPGAKPMRVVGYLASWGVRSKGTRIAELPARDLTHIFYAFGRLGADGRAALGDPCLDIGVCDSTTAVNPGGNFAELRKLKERHPHLKLLVSLGGWTGSARFSDAALTDSTRRLFTETAIDVFIRQTAGLFDGLDVDWEFPVSGGNRGNIERPEDKANFTLLLAEMRRQLDAEGKKDGRHYELTIAASAGPRGFANIEAARIAELLDFIAVMTYDYHAGSREAHHNAPLYAASGDPTPAFNVDSTMRRFLAAGVPASKLLVGVPFYGRAYSVTSKANNGLFQPSSGQPAGWRGGDGDWRTLSRTRLANPGYVRHWDAAARVPFLFDSTSGTWVSYDDPQSVREKVRYVREHGLGGVFIWELGGDDGALMNAIHGRETRPTSR